MAQTMSETLQVKITADTSGLTAGVKKVKQDLQGIKKDAGGLVGSTAATNASMDQLAETMEQVRNMNVFQILRESLKGVGKQFQIAKSQFKNFGEEFATAFDFKALREGLDKNENGITGLASSMRTQLGESAKSLGAAFKSLGAAIKAVLSSTIVMVGMLVGAFLGLVAQIKMAIRRAQELAQVYADAAKIGMSVQAYQEWGYVLESVGVQADELTGLIKTLSDEQAQMAEGSEGASKAFEKLGLKVGEVVNMSQEELFTETVARLQNIESQTERTRIAYQIFGEDAAHMANVMNMSNEQMSALVNNYRALGGGASQELVNKSNVLNMSLSNLRQAWAGLTNALAEAVMPAITAVVNWLTKAIAIVRMFIQALFGLTSTAASGSGSMSSGMNSYTNSTNKATKAVEKLQRAQMGFDELNVLPGKNSSGSGDDAGLDLGGGGGLGGGFELPKIEDLGLGKFQEWIAKYKTAIQDFTTVALIGVGLAMMVAGGFAGFNIPVMLAGAALAGVGLAIGNVEGGTFDRFADRFPLVAAVIKGVVDGIILLFKTLFDLVGAVFKTIIESIEEFVQISKEGVKMFLSGIREMIQGLLDFISGMFDFATALMTGDWAAAGEALKKIFSGLGDFIAGTIRAVLAVMATQLAAIVVLFKNLWTNIKGIFSNWGDFFSGLVTKIKSIFKDIGQKISDTLGSSIKGVFNSIFSNIESRVNKFINQINSAISVVNKIPGVNLSKLSTISLPRLATGGIVTGSTIANIGEAGAEAVLPLERNTEWMDTLADKIASRNSAPSKIVLAVDGKELGWASINGINGITKQTGSLQLTLV